MNHRVFAAIDLSAEARRAAAKYIERLGAEFPDAPVRWERPEKLHITVKFAGSLDDEQVSIFTERARSVAKSVAPFRMKISGCAAFVKRRGPCVLWLGVEQLSDIDSICALAKELGHEARPFHPHVTVARIKDAKKAKELIDRHRDGRFETEAFEVNEIVIYESELFPAGSLYRRLNGFILGVI